MWLTNSSIGRKVLMSVTGIALILFLTFHACMNVVALIDGDAYNTPLKHDHKQQIQQDIQPTGDGQQKQRCFAVPQRLHDGAVQIISQGKNRPGKNNRHI